MMSKEVQTCGGASICVVRSPFIWNLHADWFQLKSAKTEPFYQPKPHILKIYMNKTNST